MKFWIEVVAEAKTKPEAVAGHVKGSLEKLYGKGRVTTSANEDRGYPPKTVETGLKTINVTVEVPHSAAPGVKLPGADALSRALAWGASPNRVVDFGELPDEVERH
jgi:hypothetical protein